MQHRGVLDAQRRRRNPGCRRVVARRSSVRAPDRVRRNRPDQARDGAHARGGRGAVGSNLPRGDVVGERHVEQHDLPLRVGPALLQLVQRAHHQHRRGDAGLGCPDAHAETEHGELRAARLHQLGRLLAPHPVRYHHGLAVHVLQAVRLHLLEDPVDRRLQARRPAQAVPERVHQSAQPLVGEAVARGAADQAVGGGAIRDGDVGLLRPSRVNRQRDQSQGEQGKACSHESS
jgi:hypothetical protein